jgi:hypothetical protein
LALYSSFSPRSLIRFHFLISFFLRGVLHSKFRDMSDCQYNTNYYLGYWPYTAQDDENVQPLDDDFAARADDDDEGGGGGENRRLRAAARDASAKHAAAPALSAAAPTVASGTVEHDTDKQSQGKGTVEWTGAYRREYAVTQMRNGICAYDEKYGLYVKTSCHGK